MAATSPEREKIEIIGALLKLTEAMADAQPLLMVLDDVHWIDPSTLEFVSRWIEVLPVWWIASRRSSRKRHP